VARQSSAGDACPAVPDHIRSGARWLAGRDERKTVLIAATGGTARHSLALEHAIRPLFTYLRAVTVPTAVFAAAEDWGSAGPYASVTPFEQLLHDNN
jgi:NAD(P)H-dependent FMN reductase